MARTVIVLVLTLYGFAAAACGVDDPLAPESSPPGTSRPQTVEPTSAADSAEFGQVILATEIDAETNEPVEEVTSFLPSTPVMYATIRVQNVLAGAQILFRWTKGTAVAASIIVDIHEDTGDGWVGARVAPNGPIPAGDDWLVSVSHNGTLVDSVQFSVQ